MSKKVQQFKPKYQKYYYELHDNKDLIIEQVDDENGNSLMQVMGDFEDWMFDMQEKYAQELKKGQLFVAKLIVSDSHQTMCVYEEQLKYGGLVHKTSLRYYETIKVMHVDDFLGAVSSPMVELDLGEFFTEDVIVHVACDTDKHDLMDLVFIFPEYNVLYVIHEVNAAQLAYILGYAQIKLNVEYFPNFGDYVNEVLLNGEEMTDMEREVWSEYFYL